MSVLRFAFALLSCLLLAGSLPISDQAYAMGEKPAKPTNAMGEKPAKSIKDPRQCCMPGVVCPTPQTEGSPGCRCCGFRVDGKLVDYRGEGINSTLELDGPTIVTFVVKDKTVDAKLKAMGKGAHGQFTLKSKEFENGNSPTGRGMRIECIEVGNTSVQDRTKQFLLGLKISDNVFIVQEALLDAVPKHDPEVAEDK
jgi:hypothetical protein